MASRVGVVGVTDLDAERLSQYGIERYCVAWMRHGAGRADRAYARAQKFGGQFGSKQGMRHDRIDCGHAGINKRLRAGYERAAGRDDVIDQ